MESLFSQLNDLVETGEEACRIELLGRLDDLQMRHQTPLETHIRHRTQVRLPCCLHGSFTLTSTGGFQYLVHSACIQIGIDLGIFRTLSWSEKTLDVKTLAERLGADPDLLRKHTISGAGHGWTADLGCTGRIMRELAALRVVDQISKDKLGEYAANTNTRFYAEPDWEEAMRALCVVLRVSETDNTADDNCLASRLVRCRICRNISPRHIIEPRPQPPRLFKRS